MNHFKLLAATLLISTVTVFAAKEKEASQAEEKAITLLAKPKVEVNYAKARPGKKSQNSAAFMELHNLSQDKVEIVSASSPKSEKAELHRTSFKKGVHQMKEVKYLSIKPGKSLTLKPGGLHVMLLNLKEDLKMGDKIPVELTFKDGQKATVTAEIKKCCSDCH